jgi:hypothetical protein
MPSHTWRTHNPTVVIGVEMSIARPRMFPEHLRVLAVPQKCMYEQLYNLPVPPAHLAEPPDNLRNFLLHLARLARTAPTLQHVLPRMLNPLLQHAI